MGCCQTSETVKEQDKQKQKANGSTDETTPASELLALIDPIVKRLSDTSAPPVSAAEKAAMQDLLLRIRDKTKQFEPGSEEWGNALVRRAWEKAVAAVGQEQLGQIFYSEFFQASQGLRDSLFANTDMKMQSRLIISTVRTALRLQSLQPSASVEVLKRLGMQHAQYGTELHHYDLLGPVGIRTLRRALGEAECTHELEREWNRIYSAIATTMVAAAESDEAVAHRKRFTRSRCNGFNGVLLRALRAQQQRQQQHDAEQATVLAAAAADVGGGAASSETWKHSLRFFIADWIESASNDSQQSATAAANNTAMKEILFRIFSESIPCAAKSGNTQDIIGPVRDELTLTFLVWASVPAENSSSSSSSSGVPVVDIDAIRHNFMQCLLEKLDAQAPLATAAPLEQQRRGSGSPSATPEGTIFSFSSPPASPINSSSGSSPSTLDRLDANWVVNTLNEGLRLGVAKMACRSTNRDTVIGLQQEAAALPGQVPTESS